jgi:hypothetical protein
MTARRVAAAVVFLGAGACVGWLMGRSLTVGPDEAGPWPIIVLPLLLGPPLIGLVASVLILLGTKSTLRTVCRIGAAFLSLAAGIYVGGLMVKRYGDARDGLGPTAMLLILSPPLIGLVACAAILFGRKKQEENQARDRGLP